MSKLGDKLREANVINTHDLLIRFGDKGKDIAITYHPRPSGRMGMAQCDKAVVYSPSHKTNPGSAWYDYDRKTFIGNRAESMPKAVAWASEKYGITEWDNDPTHRGSKIPKYVLARAKKFLSENSTPAQNSGQSKAGPKV